MKTKNVLLKKVELKKLAKVLPSWTLNTKETELSQSMTFENHLNALVYIARITVHAQVLNHHPEIVFTYKKLKIKLTTHELKGISSLDVEFAKRIDTVTKRG